MKIIAEFDEQDYGLICKADEVKPLMEALNHLYGTIWMEACYDPQNESTREICRRMLPYIKKANQILHFKK